jgi:flagellar motor protein MotB
MVTNISKQRLLMLFIEALAYADGSRLTSLPHYKMPLARPETCTMSCQRANSLPKRPSPQKVRRKTVPEGLSRERSDRRQHQKGIEKEKAMFQLPRALGTRTQVFRKRKSSLHRGVLRQWAEEVEQEQVQDEIHMAEEETTQEDVKGNVVATLSRVPKFHTLKVRGVLQGHRVVIYGGATHNFIDVAWVSRQAIPTKEFEGLTVQ